MAASHRSQKVADRIKVIVAQLLETKIKDPRLGFVTVTDARVTGDLQQASVFYTVLGDIDQRAATTAMRTAPTLKLPSSGLYSPIYNSYSFKLTLLIVLKALIAINVFHYLKVKTRDCAKLKWRTH